MNRDILIKNIHEAVDNPPEKGWSRRKLAQYLIDNDLNCGYRKRGIVGIIDRLGLKFNEPHSKIPEKQKQSLSPEEIELLKDYRESKSILDEECNKNGVDPSLTSYFWLKTKKVSALIDLRKQQNETLIDCFNDIVENHVYDKFKRWKPVKLEKEFALKATTTDDHVGMNPDPGQALFQYEYNGEIYTDKVINEFFPSILEKYSRWGTFDVLYLDNLGDEADGWKQETERGGHNLPQNMTDAEVFNAIVDTKVRLIRNLVESKVANKIVVRSCANNNHSATFGEIINLAIQKIINLIYGKEVVEIDILTRFLEHRVYGDHCFIMTHGKDKGVMNRGLPLDLNDKAEKLIRSYIDHYNIKSPYIHVEKGDLHQIGYNRTKLFDYRNFMSFAPPSNWVGHNFGDTYSGYSIQVIEKYGSRVDHADYFLDYKKL